MIIGRLTNVGRATLFAALIATVAPSPTHACGADTDCHIGARHYRLRMPSGHDGIQAVGAIVFAHGYRGSAAGVMGNAALAAVADRLGVALIATKSAGEDWVIPGAPNAGTNTGAEEYAYHDAVLADAAARFPIDRDRLLATGFSAGGMMTWELACRRPGAFAGFAPISGTFWQPVPEACDPPVASILHFHGLSDPVVPLEGRPIADARQGDVAEALEMYARFGGFGEATPQPEDGLDCTARMAPSGAVLGACLFEGGHYFDAEYVALAWRVLVEGGGL